MPAPEPVVLRGGLNVVTPHAPEAYPGLQVVRPGSWRYAVIVPRDGDTIVARGGETLYGYRTPDGGVADGFRLEPGDRATRVRSDLPWSMAEWRVERSGRGPAS